MNTSADAARPQTIVEPKSWLDSLFTAVSMPITFGWDVIGGLSETLSLVGHGVQAAEAAVINTAGSILDQAIVAAEPALYAIAILADECSNPLLDAIGDAIAGVATFIFGLIGVETPSFDGFGCYGM